MPSYTVETTYHLPVYRQRSYDAATLEDACRLALEDEGWDDGKEDVDASGETYVTGIWEGANAAYSGHAVPVPDEFDEIVKRKAELFGELVSVLRHPARPMGLSQWEFGHWLPRALAVMKKADAILASMSGAAAPDHDPQQDGGRCIGTTGSDVVRAAQARIFPWNIAANLR